MTQPTSTIVVPTGTMLPPKVSIVAINRHDGGHATLDLCLDLYGQPTKIATPAHRPTYAQVVWDVNDVRVELLVAPEVFGVERDPATPDVVPPLVDLSLDDVVPATVPAPEGILGDES